jgi:hypothetical protein
LFAFMSRSLVLLISTVSFSKLFFGGGP